MSSQTTRWHVLAQEGTWAVVVEKGPFLWPVATYATQDEADAALQRLDANERRRLVRFFFGR
jgi:hypothetical protein